MKKLNLSWLLCLLLLCFNMSTQAQTNVGGNTPPDNSAVLQATSTTKGFLPPVMTTTQRDAISNPAKGLLIYNSTTDCINFYDGTKWRSACASNLTAAFQSSTINCAVANSLKGDYVATVAMNSSNTKTIQIQVTSPGDYTATTDQQNGVSFSASGTISSIGTGVNIVLTASGTPSFPGTYTYTVSVGGQTCTFPITYANPPAQVSNVDCQSSVPAAGNYTTGNVMIATNTKGISVTPSSLGFYNITTGAVNGVTFSTSGTFSASQVNTAQAITLTASGIPTTAGTFTYTVSGTGITTGCSFTVTFVQKAFYLQAQPSANPTITAPTDVPFSSSIVNGINVSGNNFTLKAGKTYRLSASLIGPFSSAAGDFIEYSWVDASNNKLAAANNGIQLNSSYPDHAVASDATAIVTVGSTDMVVKLRTGFMSGTFYLQAYRSYAVVEEIPSSTQYIQAIPGALTGASVVYNAAGDVPGNALLNSGVAVSNGVYTLKAGKTYRLAANLYGNFAGAPNLQSAYMQYAWVTASNNALLAGSNYGLQVASSYSGNHDGTSEATDIYTVGSSDITVKLRITEVGTIPFNLQPLRSYVVIQEVTTGAYYFEGQPTTSSLTINNGTPTDVIFSATANSGISVSGASITLKAGRTYRLTGNMFGYYDITNGFTEFKWVDASNNALPGANTALQLATTYPNHGSHSNASAIVVVGAADMVIKLRYTTVYGNKTQQGWRSYVNISEIK